MQRHLLTASLAVLVAAGCDPPPEVDVEVELLEESSLDDGLWNLIASCEPADITTAVAQQCAAPRDVQVAAEAFTPPPGGLDFQNWEKTPDGRFFRRTFRDVDALVEFMTEFGSLYGEMTDVPPPGVKDYPACTRVVHPFAIDIPLLEEVLALDKSETIAAAAESMRVSRYHCETAGYDAACAIHDAVAVEVKTISGTRVALPPSGNNVPQPSVLVELPGGNPECSAVLVGAHLDSYKKVWLGIEDNLSGVLVLLAALEAIVEKGWTFDRTLYLAFYANEEWGFSGSLFLREQYDLGFLGPLHTVINLDMVGHGGSGKKFFAAIPPDGCLWETRDVEQLVAKNFEVEQLVVENVPYRPASDNRIFDQTCVPTIPISRHRFGLPVAIKHTKDDDSLDAAIVNDALRLTLGLISALDAQPCN